MQKNNNRFKNLKIIIKKQKIKTKQQKKEIEREGSPELQKPAVEAEAYNINKKMCPKKKNKK